jgi:hypothetical protein
MGANGGQAAVGDHVLDGLLQVTVDVIEDGVEGHASIMAGKLSVVSCRFTVELLDLRFPSSSGRA